MAAMLSSRLGGTVCCRGWYCPGFGCPGCPGWPPCCCPSPPCPAGGAARRAFQYSMQCLPMRKRPRAAMALLRMEAWRCQVRMGSVDTPWKRSTASRSTCSSSFVHGTSPALIGFFLSCRGGCPGAPGRPGTPGFCPGCPGRPGCPGCPGCPWPGTMNLILICLAFGGPGRWFFLCGDLIPAATPRALASALRLLCAPRTERTPARERDGLCDAGWMRCCGAVRWVWWAVRGERSPAS
eukprot:283894-Rhodomonas_salina.1